MKTNSQFRFWIKDKIPIKSNPLNDKFLGFFLFFVFPNPNLDLLLHLKFEIIFFNIFLTKNELENSYTFGQVANADGINTSNGGWR